MSDQANTRGPQSVYLLPPPRRLQHGELPPVIEPALEGVPAFQGRTPDHFEPFASEAIPPPVSVEAAERIRAAVLEHRAVKERLAGGRFEWIGVSALEEKSAKDRVERTFVAILYSYDQDRAIEVRLDRDGERVRDVSVHAYQPPASDDEIRRAIELARSHPRLATELDDGLVALPILVSTPSNHRMFEVRFGYPSDRLPRFNVTVDLSRNALVRLEFLCVRVASHSMRREGVQP